MRTATLTHGTLNRPVTVRLDQVAFFYKATDGTTHLAFSMGAMLPVIETVDDVNRLMNGAQDEPKESK